MLTLFVTPGPPLQPHTAKHHCSLSMNQNKTAKNQAMRKCAVGRRYHRKQHQMTTISKKCSQKRDPQSLPIPYLHLPPSKKKSRTTFLQSLCSHSSIHLIAGLSGCSVYREFCIAMRHSKLFSQSLPCLDTLDAPHVQDIQDIQDKRVCRCYTCYLSHVHI